MVGDETIIIRGTRHVVWECLTCGCVSTVPEVMNDQMRAEGGYRHCPSGHSWGWSKEKSERERLRRERDQLKQRIAMVEDEKRQETERAAKAEKQTARLKKRASAGVCSCCNRTFTNMARHMKTKHPNVVAMKTA